MDTKRCFKCGVHKPRSEFYKRSSAKDGLQGNCKSCKTKYNQSHYKENTEVYKTRRAAWREAHGKPWQLHNLTEDTYNDMVNRYNGNCWLCKTRQFAQIDHDHNCCSGVNSCGNCVRGLLCMSCNTALGKLGDTLDSLREAVLYLEQYEQHEPVV